MDDIFHKAFLYDKLNFLEYKHDYEKLLSVKDELLYHKDYKRYEKFINKDLITPNIFLYNITDACQLHCKHCYHYGKKRHSELSFDDFIYVYKKNMDLRQFYINSGFKYDEPIYYTIMGGEPLLSKDLYKIVKFLTDKDCYIKINSNGLIIDKDICLLLRNRERCIYQVSLDGYKDINDYIRGDGVYKTVIKNIYYLRKLCPQIEIVISYNVNTLNYKCVLDFVQAINNIGVNKIMFNRYVPCNNNIDALNNKEYSEFVNILNSIPTYYDVNIDMSRILFSTSFYNCHCSQQMQVCDSNGDKLLCPRLNIKAGNWFQDSIKTIIYNSVKYAIETQCVPYECLDCVYVNSCAGGMKCLTYYSTNSFSNKDVNCYFYKKRKNNDN